MASSESQTKNGHLDQADPHPNPNPRSTGTLTLTPNPNLNSSLRATHLAVDHEGVWLCPGHHELDAIDTQALRALLARRHEL